MKNPKATSTPFEFISTSTVPFGRFVGDRDILCSGCEGLCVGDGSGPAGAR